jgi:vacuolar-type H+-ATPase subunit F/Vma7
MYDGRVQVNVFEEEMTEMLAPFSEPERERIIRLWEELLEKLLDLTRSENKKIKQAAIIAVAATADSLKERFAKVQSP